MKQIILLLCAIVITITLCSSVAQAGSLFIKQTPTPQAFTLEQNDSENFNFPKVKVINEHNSFYELSIVFNEKLQQFIAFLFRSNNKSSNSVGDFSSSTNPQTINKCKASS